MMIEKLKLEQFHALINSADSINYDAIANWAYETRLDGIGVLSQEILDALEELGACSMGPEFEWTKEELLELFFKLNK